MPRKGENIYKRKDGRWEGRYIRAHSPAGKTLYGYVYAKSYHEVRAKLHEKIECGVIRQTTPDASRDFFSPLANEWLESITPQLKESTKNKYHNLLHSYILPSFEGLRFENITYDFIDSYCGTLLSSGGQKKRGLSPKTVADTLSVIRNILKYASRKGIFIPCDASSIRIRRAHREMRVLSKNEQENLCRYLYFHPNPYHMGILICLFTGLRIGEVCALRWEDISLSEKTMYIHGTLQRVQCTSNTGAKTKVVITQPKSPSSIRIIPIPEPLLQLLADYQTASVGYLLTNSDSHFIEPRNLQNHFQRVLKENGIAPINYHAIRHTFATRCVELGFDVKSLSEILGHSTVNITMNRYVHPTLELKKENMQRLSELFSVK